MANNVAAYQKAMKLGEAYSRQGQWKQAFQAFRSALAEFPQRPEPYAGLGDACFGLKMVDRALESYKLAARYSRGDIRYIQQVADLQERSGQLSEAAPYLPGGGRAELRQRHLEAAVANWERAVRLEPALPELTAGWRWFSSGRTTSGRRCANIWLLPAFCSYAGEQDKALQM